MYLSNCIKQYSSVLYPKQTNKNKKEHSKSCPLSGASCGADASSMLLGISAFTPQNSHCRQPHLYTRGKWGSERLSHLPEITLQTGGFGIQTQEYLFEVCAKLSPESTHTEATKLLISLQCNSECIGILLTVCSQLSFWGFLYLFPVSWSYGHFN